MDFHEKRRFMVENDLKGRDITDPHVLKAMSEVPREEFVSPEARDVAYGDFPLPIGEGQTISQPYIVALMTQALGLEGDEKVLEVGTGSGYQAAVLSRLANKVFSVERFPSLAERSMKILGRLSYLNVEVLVSDGTLGYEREAPYDAIIVTAACFKIPQSLIDQLADGGRLVIPIGNEFMQELLKLTKIDGKVQKEKICDCRFVPLVGEDGYKDPE